MKNIFYGFYISNPDSETTPLGHRHHSLTLAFMEHSDADFGICLGHRPHPSAPGATTSKVEYGSHGNNTFRTILFVADDVSSRVKTSGQR